MGTADDQRACIPDGDGACDRTVLDGYIGVKVVPCVNPTTGERSIFMRQENDSGALVSALKLSVSDALALAARIIDAAAALSGPAEV
jgi:hypothetical protein